MTDWYSRARLDDGRTDDEILGDITPRPLTGDVPAGTLEYDRETGEYTLTERIGPREFGAAFLLFRFGAPVPDRLARALHEAKKVGGPWGPCATRGPDGDMVLVAFDEDPNGDYACLCRAMANQVIAEYARPDAPFPVASDDEFDRHPRTATLETLATVSRQLWLNAAAEIDRTVYHVLIAGWHPVDEIGDAIGRAVRRRWWIPSRRRRATRVVGAALPDWGAWHAHDAKDGGHGDR